MNRRHLHRIKRRDTIARWVIKTGGIGVIFCVFGMLALIASTALPLFFPAKASPVAVAPGAADAGATNGTLAVLVDDDRLAVWSLRADGTAELREVGSGKLLEKKRIRPDGADRKIVACEAAGAQNFSLLWDDGAALAVKVEFKAATAADGIKSVTCGVRTLWRVQRPEGVTDGGINAKNGRTEERKNGIKDERKNGRAEQDVRNTPDVHDTRNAHSAAACQAVALRPGDEGGAPSTTVACPAVALRPGNEGGAPSTTVACPAVALRPGEEGGGTQVWHLADGNFLVIREKTESDPMGEEKTTRAQFTVETAAEVTAWTLSRDGGMLYAGSASGGLMRWDVTGGKAELLDRTRLLAAGRGVTALGLVFGDLSVAVGDSAGGVTVWSPASIYGPDGAKHLALTHTLAAHKSPVRRFFFTQHDKGVLSLSDDGVLHVSHMTSERLMLELAGISPAAVPALSARGSSLCALGADGRTALWSVRNPHPEVGAKVLFGKVWYENYDKPELVWQSSSSNDDAEAKLSLIPLLFGSLKATFYALLLAIPLALAGALYTSQFAPLEVKAVVKPAVEIMAAVPSVVIGFIAALWLAPKLEAGILSVAVFAVALPLVFIVFMLSWMRLVRPTALGRRIDKGWEFAVVAPVLLGAAALAWWLGPLAERLLFAGDFKLWLFREAGWRVDQRNSIVIAFALGFAVIPVLFTIAEDAFSNVPKSLKAASLALGASRWQTVWRVVLPGASPGVFAAIIIGFGRAVGETMIVLMATGNTPVLDWGPFSGMRTLSANIAVEIPEAAAGGTLYRVLFLSAVLLFVLTSVLNTAAEVIRSKLRKRYAE